MLTKSLDWSSGKVNVKTEGVDQQEIFVTLPQFLDTLVSPTRIVCESTVESFLPDHREAFINRCREEGHELLLVNPRCTPRRRRALGFEEKTDEADVVAIESLALDGRTHLKKPTKPTDEYLAKFAAAKHEIMRLRNTTEMVPKRGGGYTFKRAKDIWAAELIETLPCFEALPHEVQLCLGTVSGYSLAIVAAVGVCAKYASNRREFERLAGLYSHGYPSQIRSDLFYHGYWRRHTKHGISLSTYRRALRWLYRQLVVGIGKPATGMF